MFQKIITTLSLPTLALSMMSQQMIKEFEDLAKEIDPSKFELPEDCKNNPDQEHCKLRSFGSSWAQKMIDSIDGYGCWCYFQNEHGQGRGEAQNEVDLQCKILHNGYSCIIEDAQAMEADDIDFEDPCIPWDVEYNSASGLGMVVTNPNNQEVEQALRHKCRKANKDNWCAEKSCVVENYFIIKTLHLFLKGVEFNPKLKHSLGFFDPRADCPIKQGRGDSERLCCGEYPVRFPYKTLGGERGCCVNKTFSTTRLHCCDDGSVRLSCY